MGTVAVISEVPILLHELHVNLWILPGLARQVRFLDIGFRFELNEGELDAFELAIPGSGKKKPEDLSQLITPESGSLIFGVPIVREPSGKIFRSTESDPGQPWATVVELSEFESRRDDDLEAGIGLWRCRLAKPWSRANGRGYCRVRFFVPNPGRMWTHPGVSPLDGRSLFDVRVLDVRENATSALAADMRNRGQEVRLAVNTHLIVPEEFEILDTAEHHKYVRLLEAEAWRHYLGRRANLPMTRPKMLAVSWEKRADDDHPAAGLTRPARFACMLRKHTLTLALGRLLAAIVVAGLVAWFLVGPELFQGGATDDVVGWLNENVPAKLSDIPVADGVVEDLLQVVLSIPVLGMVAAFVVLILWSKTRQFLGRMRSGLEALLVRAENHGSY